MDKSRINEENRKLHGKARLQDILLNLEVSILLKFEQQWLTVRVPEACLGLSQTFVKKILCEKSYQAIFAKKASS